MNTEAMASFIVLKVDSGKKTEGFVVPWVSLRMLEMRCELAISLKAILKAKSSIPINVKIIINRRRSKPN